MVYVFFGRKLLISDKMMYKNMINGIATNCRATSKITEKIRKIYLIWLETQEKFLNLSANNGISEISK
jgi:hypothetical protein